MAKSAYDVHPSVRMVQDWIESLKGRTGRTLEQWVALTKEQGPAEEAKRREWLKKEHGFGTNNAWWIAERCRDEAQDWMTEGNPESYLKAAAVYVEEQYAGKKEGLRPIFERLLKLGRGLGKDVRVCPCKTIVPLYRNHVFAQVKPATNTRVDLGLALAKFAGKIPARLIDTGGKEKKDRITHRIPLGNAEEIDAGVERWLKVAYDLDG
jgi:hypothetical protein